MLSTLVRYLIVDRNRTARGQRDTDRLEPQIPCTFGERPVAYNTRSASIVRPSASTTRRAPFVVSSTRATIASNLQIDVLFAKLIGDERSHAVVEPAQKQRASVQQRRSCAESGEDAGKLDGDVAAADDDHALGKLRRDRTLRST